MWVLPPGYFPVPPFDFFLKFNVRSCEFGRGASDASLLRESTPCCYSGILDNYCAHTHLPSFLSSESHKENCFGALGYLSKLTRSKLLETNILIVDFCKTACIQENVLNVPTAPYQHSRNNCCFKKEGLKRVP